jgi:flagellar protein FlbD
LIRNKLADNLTVYYNRGDYMIYITKFNHETVLINQDLIEQVEATPDTVITLTTGKKLVILESMKEIYEKVMEARQLSNQTGFIK